MKQPYRKGLFVRLDLPIYELKCSNCLCDFIFTLDELYYRNQGVNNEFLGRVLCPKCKRRNNVNRNDKFKPKKEED